MQSNQLTERLGLEERHFRTAEISAPLIDTHLYTTLGRRLFEMYQKYDLNPADQREIESLVFLLTAFTLHESRSVPEAKGLRRPWKFSWWRSLWK